MKTDDFSRLRQLTFVPKSVRKATCPLLSSPSAGNVFHHRWFRGWGEWLFCPVRIEWRHEYAMDIQKKQEWDTNRNGDWHGWTPGCAGRAPIGYAWPSLNYYLHQSNPHSSWGAWIILAATLGLFGIHYRPILDIFSGTADPGFRFT